jgi:hypothetical protein
MAEVVNCFSNCLQYFKNHLLLYTRAWLHLHPKGYAAAIIEDLVLLASLPVAFG